MTSTFDLAGMNLKEWAFIVLMINLTLITIMVVISFVIAIQSGQTITITGGINLDQLMVVIISIAAVATILVSQQLTTKAAAAIVSAANSTPK